MILFRLASIADELDNQGLYLEANLLDKALQRFADMNLHNEEEWHNQQVRMDDDSPYGRELYEDDQIRQQHPRYQQKPFYSPAGSTDPDDETAESPTHMNGEESSGITEMVRDPFSAGMSPRGVEDFEWDTVNRDNRYPNLPAH